MPFNARLALREEDVVRLALEFFDNRELHITQLSLERETGVINGQYSDDVLFLRQLILDGQWDDVIEFIQPLETLPEFNMKKFCYTILRHKYVELLCIKSEAGGSITAPGQGVNSMEGAVEEVVQVLEQLEKLAPTKEDYSNLCLLLTFPRLADHLQFRDWNPSKARVQCFREVYPLVEKYLPHDSKLDCNPSAKNDRLIQLLIKGVLYESCVSYCQGKATGQTRHFQDDMCFSKLLDGSVGFSDSDLSLLSWLQSIPAEIFSVPFEQKTLNVDVERLERPTLETSWTEHMMITPIKPKTFPHSVMPFTRPRSAADVMTRSLIPNLEGLPFGLNAAKINETLEKNNMSRSSFASFHLTGMKPASRNVMVSSVDRLFTNDATNGIVSTNNNHGEFESLPSIQEIPGQKLKDLKISDGSHLSDPQLDLSHDKTTSSSGRNSPATATSTAKSSRRDSLTERNFFPEVEIPFTHPHIDTHHHHTHPHHNSHSTINQHNATTTTTATTSSTTATSNSHHNSHQTDSNQQQHHNHGTINNLKKDDVGDTAAAANVQHQQYSQNAMYDKPQPNVNSHSVTSTNSQVKTDSTQFATRMKGELFEKYHQQKLNKEIDTTTTAAAAAVITAGDSTAIGPTDSSLKGTSNNQIKQTSGAAIQQKSQPPITQQNQQSIEVENSDRNNDNDANRPQFVAVTTLEDVQAVRCAEFHPSGTVYSVGSNSKTFRICEYPSLAEVQEHHVTYQPTVLFKRTKHHKGSIYCMGWSPDGELVATGSNDKTIKLMRYNDTKKQLEGREIELTMHDGTIRDLCFLEETTNKTSLLISGGAGDCKIYVTDCATATPFQALTGHGGHILSLYNWGGAIFVSGSQDKTIRFWDLRTRGCVNTVTPVTSPTTRQGSSVSAVCVDPSGRLLVSGHEDSSCVLYDIRGIRPIQCFKPHTSDIRSIRFSPSAYYLLTAGYDNKLVLTDLQGDLTLPLPSVVVAQHSDKVISGRWHPTDFSFISTSADKTATLWALPPL